MCCCGLFAWATLHALHRHRSVDVVLVADGQEIRRRTPFVFVGNNFYEMEDENDKVIGFITGVNEEKCTWVDLLGVRRNGRRRGIGKALLQLLLKESYRRGANTVALNVDADSPTNAHKLYCSIGMRPVFQIAMYEKKYGQ
jgi:GNAT superfamily N-acetyltransferase